jgi:hypothetical protein
MLISLNFEVECIIYTITVSEDDLNNLNKFVDQGHNWLFYLDTDKCNMYVTKEALEKRGLSLKQKVDFSGIRLIQVVHK